MIPDGSERTSTGGAEISNVGSPVRDEIRSEDGTKDSSTIEIESDCDVVQEDRLLSNVRSDPKSTNGDSSDQCVATNSTVEISAVDRSTPLPALKRRYISSLYDHHELSTTVRESRSKFPPYGSVDEEEEDSTKDEKAIRMITQSTQTDFEYHHRSRKQLRNDKKKNNICRLRGIVRDESTTIPRLSSVATSSALANWGARMTAITMHSTTKVRDSNSSIPIRISTYKAPTILPQRMGIFPHGRPSTMENRGGSPKRSRVEKPPSMIKNGIEKPAGKDRTEKKSTIKRDRNGTKIVDGNRTEKSTIGGDRIYSKASFEFPRRLPSIPVSSTIGTTRPTSSYSYPSLPRLPPECARHRPFNGMRKSRNWFSFLSHPYRSEWLRQLQSHRSKAPTAMATTTAATINGDDDESSSVPPARKRIAAIKATASISKQYDWFRNNPVAIRLAKSRIHGIGVFADEDIGVGQFIVEYKGEMIRNCLVDHREKFYRNKGLGSYMFQIDLGFTIDGTMKGGMARFVNHSCDPNCTARIIKCDDRKKHIILIAAKRISKGDELSYDYKMPKDRDKITCLCGTSVCRRYLN